MKKSIIAFSILIPLLLGAQSVDIPVSDLPVNPDSGLPTGIEEQVSVTVLPSVPAPRETVTLTVESFSTNLDKADFTWTVNGEVIESGIGKRIFKFIAPDSGETAVVKFTAKKEGGGVLSREFPFTPSGVDILWEAQTYTPPFYKGKSLFTRQSSMVFVAIPNLVNPATGQKIPDNELVYKWEKSGSVIQDQSGYGRNTVRLTSDIISRPFEMTVTVSAVNVEGLKARQRLTVVPFEPELLLYENNPVYGIIFEKALLGDFEINRDEIEISAVPYHFSTSERDDVDLQYKWLLNNKQVQTYSNRDSLTFRKVEESVGRADINISASSVQKILQASDTRFSIILDDLNNDESTNSDSSVEDFTF